MKYIHLLPLLLVLLLIGCKKKENDDPRPKCQTVLHAPQEFLDYWFFPKGSWWVYKLKGSQPAVYDTVRNGNRHRAYFTQPYEELLTPTDYCEMFYIHDLAHSNSTYFGSTVPGRLGAEGIVGYRMGDKWVVQQDWDSFGHASEGFIFFYPFNIGEVFFTAHNWVADTNAVTTPMGTFYQSVGMFVNNEHSQDTTFYPQRRIHLSKGIGITKRRYYNGQVWELVNYHINR